jgi:hypothetical protein
MLKVSAFEICLVPVSLVAIVLVFLVNVYSCPPVFVFVKKDNWDK